MEMRSGPLWNGYFPSRIATLSDQSFPMLKKGSLLLFFLLAAPFAASAQTAGPVGEGLDAVGTQAGLGSAELPVIVGNIIYIFLGFMGIVLLAILLYAGWRWMTAGGDAKQIEEAKLWIRNGIIGLIIIVSAFAITRFIIDQLSGITSGGGIGGGSPFGSGGGFPGSGGSLGGGIIESHLPGRDATGVPRNTRIVITFKEPIRISSFIAGYNDNGTPADLSDDIATSTTVGLNSDAVKIYVNGQRDSALTTAEARVRFTADRQTFVISPVAYLGSPTVDTDYTAELLSGASGIRLEDGSPAFTGAFGSGYRWNFQVSTVIDTTPPKVSSVIPTRGGSYAPNIVVQLNFNEAIDPTSAAGIVTAGSGFTNIRVASSIAGGAPTFPNGEFRISNQYRTVEFTTDLACGTNSCGRTVYCLPTDASIEVTAQSPTLSDTPPQAFLSGFGYNGIVDMVGNALDGNADGIAQGSPDDGVDGNDNYAWSFGTSGAPNLSAPRILSTDPIAGDTADSSNLSVDVKPEATFDSVLQASTLVTDNVLIRSNEPLSLADTWWWNVSQENLTAAGTPLTGPDDIAAQGRVSIGHRIFVAATSTDPSAIVPLYQPVFRSGVQNVYQNCFNPAASAACSADSRNPNCCDGRSQSAACTAPTPTP